jgi:hypothetical protein
MNTSSINSITSITSTTSTITCLLTKREERLQRRGHKGAICSLQRAPEQSTTTSSVSASASSNLLLCNFLQIATGLPYSESPRWPNSYQIRCNLICFRPVRSFDLLGLGSSLYSALKNSTLRGGPVSQCYLLHEPIIPHCGLICGLTASINPLLALSLNIATGVSMWSHYRGLISNSS